MAAHELQEGEIIDVILLCAMLVAVTWGATALAGHFGWSVYSWHAHTGATPTYATQDTFSNARAGETSAARAQRLQDMTQDLR